MNIGTILDELGLDALAPGDPDRPDAGPDRPLEDEESDAEDGDDPGAPDAPDGEDGGDAESDDVEAEAESGGSGGLFGRGSNDEADGELVERLNDLEYELDEVRNYVEENEASIDGLESEQTAMAERMDQIEEHNATLLGVYDQLTEDVNPFTGDVERTAERDRAASESTYGVIPDGEDDGGATDRRGDDRDDGDDAATSHDDVRTDTAEPDADEWEFGPGTESDETDDDGAAPGTSRAEPDPEPRPAPAATPDSTPARGQSSEEGPYLTEFADTYATDVLVMEWLTMLIETAGEEGALKALDHYDRIDWVSESIRRELEIVLSGARCEGETDPRNDLSTDVHDRSFRYIARLSQQAQLAKSDYQR